MRLPTEQFPIFKSQKTPIGTYKLQKNPTILVSHASRNAKCWVRLEQMNKRATSTLPAKKPRYPELAIGAAGGFDSKKSCLLP